MRALSLLAAVLCPLLGGCATAIPTFDLPKGPDGEPTVASIRQRVVCELVEIVSGSQLAQAMARDYDFGVTLQLTLSTTDDGSLAPTFNYTDGPFAFGTGFKVERSRQQQFTEQMFYPLSEIAEMAILPEARAGCDRPVDTDLAGRIGIKESFDLAIGTGNGLKTDVKDLPGVFGGTVTFIVNRELSATGPTWTLRRFKGPGTFASASDNGQDKLLFAFTAGNPSGRKAAKDGAKRGVVKGGVVAKMTDGADRARFAGEQFIANLIQTQIAVSLSSISQAMR